MDIVIFTATTQIIMANNNNNIQYSIITAITRKVKEKNYCNLRAAEFSFDVIVRLYVFDAASLRIYNNIRRVKSILFLMSYYPK